MRNRDENRLPVDAHVFDIDQIRDGLWQGFGVGSGQLLHDRLMQLFLPLHHGEKRAEFVGIVAVFGVKRPELLIRMDRQRRGNNGNQDVICGVENVLRHQAHPGRTVEDHILVFVPKRRQAAVQAACRVFGLLKHLRQVAMRQGAR